ncbi:MAG: adenylate/guanylate cyclase domain-containing protein [Baaleninema sp.]
MKHSIARFSVLPHISFILIDRQFSTIEVSERAAEFIGLEGDIELGSDIFDLLPELFGLDAVFETILNGGQDDFSLPAIARCDASGTMRYLDLFVVRDAMAEERLVLFLEDVTHRMELEQTLVQSSNEMSLLVEKLSASEAYVEQMVRSMPDALIVTSLSGTIVKTNSYALDLLGYSEDELLGQPLLDILEDKNFDIAEIQRFLFEDEGEILKNIELVCCCRDRHKAIVSFSCSVKPARSEEPAQFIYIGRDITKSYRAQRRLMAQNTITNILSQAQSFASALPKLLQGLGEGLDWDLCEFWQPASREQDNGEPPETHLHCVDFWAKPFIDTSKWYPVTFGRSCGWVEAAWQEGRALWLSVSDSEWVSDRAAVCDRLLLATVVLCPLQVDEERIGLLTLFCQNIADRDEELLQMMDTVGNQIGQFFQRKLAEEALRREQIETEKLLLNILPAAIAKRLKDESKTIADDYTAVTILFADIVGFTKLSSQIPATELVQLLNYVFSAFDRLSERHGLEKIKTIGDAYMVVGGLPEPRPDHAESVAHMALDMQQVITEFNRQTQSSLDIRIGIHTGPVVAGVIGLKKFVYDLWGDTVNIASRMESHGVAGQIQVSVDTYERIRSSFVLTERGTIHVKGKGDMKTYFLLGRKGTAEDGNELQPHLPSILQANRDIAELIQRKLKDR